MAENESQIKEEAQRPPAHEKKSYFRVPKWAMYLLVFLLVACAVLAIVLPLTVSRKETVSNDGGASPSLVAQYDVLKGPSPFDFDYANVEDPTASYSKARRSAKEVFDSLTWEQKLGQISQYSRGDYSGPGLGDDSIEAWLGLIANGGAGSFLNVNNRDDVITFQKAAGDTGSKVPLLIGYDTIHGYRTGFPVNLGMAASFDRKMHREYAGIAAKETLAHQIRWTFAPMLDTARDPRWGRISESSGEDPYLTGELGVEIVQGFQENGVAACVKHFAAYGAAQAGRDYSTAQLGTAYLHNDYLPAYKKALLKGKALSVMASFNTVDGVPMHANRNLLTDVLRGLWGWDGLVVSDYGGIRELRNHQVAGSEYEAGNISLVAGVDMAMADGYFYHPFLDKDPKTTMPRGGTLGDYVDLAAKRVLAVKGALGLLDAQASVPSEVPLQELYDSYWLLPDYLKAAQTAAEKSMVLLKNEGLLPLTPKAGGASKYLVLGSLANHGGNQRGSWAGQTAWDSFDDPEGNKQAKTITYWQALQQRAAKGEFQVEWEPGYDSPWQCNETTADLNKAIDKATSGGYDAVIAVVGEASAQNGEATSRTDLHLSGCQRVMLEQIRAGNGLVPIILVVNAGRQLILDWEDTVMNAIVYAWASGTMGGPALANILFGDVNPSGKMPVTTPRSVGQIPLYYSQLKTGRPLTNAIVGIPPHSDANDWSGSPWYVSSYIDNFNSPLYYFGYGMSYSTYKYSKPTLARDGDQLNVTISVTMTDGPSNLPEGRTSDEIVQLYVKDLKSSISPPEKRLRGFERLSFSNPDETVEHTFVLSIEEDFGFYDNSLNWVVEPGAFRIYVTRSASINDEDNYVEITI